MAEVKNSFLKSKMNKDLDDRLVPSGEYRDGLNIDVGKSEFSDVGALQVVLGNEFIAASTPINNNLVCIGQIADNQNNKIYQFWTDYFDPSLPGDIQIPTAGDMRITVYEANASGGTIKTLVSGLFLNFASNNDFRIYGVNILENLLFWTDNRNQPRKINIAKASIDPLYYTKEHQISVARYAPVFPISVYKEVTATSLSASTFPTPISTSITVLTSEAEKLSLGMQYVHITYAPLEEYAVIVGITNNPATNPPNSTITLGAQTLNQIPQGTKLYFHGCTMSNESDNINWPGDPAYLKDKYVRFSYRYKSEDGEYSLMAPFTQIIYIPNQNGYFQSGDEDSAYRSTIVDWMENNINNVILNIQLPDSGNNLGNSYKVTAIDILYKESDSNTVKVLESVEIDQIKAVAGDTNLYYYDYKSQKPYKTLPESQTVRVYDKTPVKARSQEVAGNRVIYGNFVNQHTPPSAINYNMAVVKKNQAFNSWAEYPNHTLKQNRNYQAGIVLSDKYGRQSSVILSSNDLVTEKQGDRFGGSTIYAPYRTDALNGVVDFVKSWRGDTLAMVVNSPIVSNKNEGTGEPGLYAEVFGSVLNSSNGFEISQGTVTTDPTIYNFKLKAGASQVNMPVAGSFLRGQNIDYVKVITISPAPNIGDPNVQYTVTADGPISNTYNYNGTTNDIKFSYRINALGWYSYKIVIRQQQQEYYNVYLPGFLNGYPKYQLQPPSITSQTPSTTNFTKFPENEIDKSAHTVLFNDNINKIPRDLVEVGPDQKQYRSSVELFGRVENTLSLTFTTSNAQYYPSKKADLASTIATSNDLNFLQYDETYNKFSTASVNFYQLTTAPTIARISTVKRIGVLATTSTTAISPPVQNSCMNPFLSIYETAPFVSALDLFWESTSAGLISDLNEDVLTDSNITIDFDNFDIDFFEFQKVNGQSLNYGTKESPYITSYFTPIDKIGNLVTTVTGMSLVVKDLSGAIRTTEFELFKETDNSAGGAGKWVIKIKSQFRFLTDAAQKENYQFIFTVIDPVQGNNTITKTGRLQNSIPTTIAPPPDVPLLNISGNDVTIVDQAGVFECPGPQTFIIGSTIKITGALPIGGGTITGYTSPTTYYIVGNSGGTINRPRFTLSTTYNGTPVVCGLGSLLGMTVVYTPVIVVNIETPVLTGWYNCDGTNGAQPVSGDADFNQQQLNWSIVDADSTTGWQNFYKINPQTGIIELTNLDLVVQTSYLLKVRLRDVYNYNNNTIGEGSLYTYRYIRFNSPITANVCSTWDSFPNYIDQPDRKVCDYPFPDDPNYSECYFVPVAPVRVSSATGAIDFWKIFLPGEVINTQQTEAYVASYTTQERALWIPNSSALVNYPSPYDPAPSLLQAQNSGQIYEFYPSKATGTFSLANGSKIVTGVGTLFTTELKVGQYLYPYPVVFDQAGTGYGKVVSIQSNTQLTLEYLWYGTSVTNIPFYDYGAWYAIPYGQRKQTYTITEGTGPASTQQWGIYFNQNNFNYQAYIGDNELYGIPWNSQGSNYFPVYTLNFGGTIVTNYRNIDLIASSTFNVGPVLPNFDTSSRTDCSAYRPLNVASNMRSWRLTNNGTNVINWKAFVPTLTQPTSPYYVPGYENDIIIGNPLAPGQSISSQQYYGGSQKRILAGSLTFGAGGTAEYSTS